MCPNIVPPRCFPESTFNESVDCKETDDRTPGCKTPSGQEGWQCYNGKCIEKQRVCDNHIDCTTGENMDSSDEDVGCSLYRESPCKSWFSLEHVECKIEGK